MSALTASARTAARADSRPRARTWTESTFRKKSRSTSTVRPRPRPRQVAQRSGQSGALAQCLAPGCRHCYLRMCALCILRSVSFPAPAEIFEKTYVGKYEMVGTLAPYVPAIPPSAESQAPMPPEPHSAEDPRRGSGPGPVGDDDGFWGAAANLASKLLDYIPVAQVMHLIAPVQCWISLGLLSAST